MKRAFVLGISGVGALLLGSVSAVFWATETPLPTDAAAPDAASRAPVVSPLISAESPPIPAGHVAPADTSQAATRSPAAATARVAPSRAAGGSLESDLVRVRRNFRDELEHGLSVLQQSVAECSAASASFKLDLESIPGGIRVKDAQIEDKGDVSDRAIACAHAKLREHVIDAPSVEPGRKWQISFAIRAP